MAQVAELQQWQHHYFSLGIWRGVKQFLLVIDNIYGVGDIHIKQCIHACSALDCPRSVSLIAKLTRVLTHH